MVSSINLNISLPQMMETALQHHSAGRFPDAEAIYQQLLAVTQDSAELFNNYGNTLICLGRSEEAERAFRQALLLRPGYTEAYNELGCVLARTERLEEAEQAFRNAFMLKPDWAMAYYNHGNVLSALGRWQSAEESYRWAITHDQEYAEAYIGLGNALAQMERVEEAEQAYLKALALKPDNATAYYNMGNVLCVAGRLEEAAQAFQKSLVLMPDNAQAHNCLGAILMAFERIEEAEQIFRKALVLKPDYPEAHCNRGDALTALGRWQLAEKCYRKALTLKPDNAEAFGGLGNALERMGQRDEAEQVYLRALALKPDIPSTQFNLSLLYLLLGRFEDGFKLYEKRYDVRTLNNVRDVLLNELKQYKRWEGGPLARKSLVVITEQGAGDNLMMMRYLPLLKERGLKRLVVYCEPELTQLFQRLSVIDEVVSMIESINIGRFDFYCHMMSFPYLFQTRLETIPGNVPYLSVPDKVKEKWRIRLAGARGMKIGLAWAGNRQHAHNHRRSISLTKFSPLLDIGGVQLVSLQKGEDAGQLKDLGWGFLDWMDMCDDYLDTAALVAELDLVISVDTSVAHLAGALGKPVWLLNRFESEWRWMLDREDSPWYPSMRIFRQKESGDWDSVIAQVAEELAQLSCKKLTFPPQDISLSDMMELALQHHKAGRFPEAAAVYRELLSIRPDSAEAYNNYGATLLCLERMEETETAFRQALDLKPDYGEAYNNLGNVLRLGGRLEEAEQASRQALALMPGNVEVLKNLGNILMDFNRIEEAEQTYRKALVLKPDYAEAYNNRGNALLVLGRISLAEKCYRQALALKPDCAEAYVGLGNVLSKLVRTDEAEQAYLRALAFKPGYATGEFNISLLYLREGRFEEGLRLYQQRFSRGGVSSTSNIKASKELQGCMKWEGEQLKGKNLLVITEQGAGDSVMMMRYLPLLKLRGIKRLVVYCEPHLARVFQSMSDVDEVVRKTEPVPIGRIDFYCTIMSLPYLFQTRLESIPDNVPYLSVPDKVKKIWRTRLESACGMKVGLSWAGNKMHADNNWRSIPLGKFSALADIDGVQLVSLQKGEDAAQLKDLGWGFPDWMDTCDDYLDTAALVAELDLVISVDTSVAHLAGALGKPVWLLNRFESEWRWMLEREDSPWYPSMRIFRQKEIGDWDSVLMQVAEELAKLTGACSMDKGPGCDSGLVSIDGKVLSLDEACLAGIRRYKEKLPEAAGVIFQRVLEADPVHPRALNALAVMAADQGDHERALAYLDTLLSAHPAFDKGYNTKGSVLLKHGQTDDAAAYFLQAIALNPSFAEAYGNLGDAHIRQGRLGDAPACYQRVLDLLPDSVEFRAKRCEALSKIGNAFLGQGLIDKAIERYRQAIETDPWDRSDHSNILLAMHYTDRYSPLDILAESQRWERQHGLGQLPRRAPTAAFPVRIGYVSPDFKNHVVIYFFAPLISAHDRSKFRVYCYSDVAEPDDITRQLEGIADNWTNCFGMPDEELAERITADRIDILVDLAGHTGNNRLRLFTMKPAPLQVSWLGYPGTTGLSAMDYRISDSIADPEGTTDRYHSETVIRLKDGFLCYFPPDDTPEVSRLPALSREWVTFCSFNNLAKINPAVLATWGKLLMRLPNSRLHLKSKWFVDEDTCQRCLNGLEAEGVDRSRVLLLPHVATLRDHLEHYRDVDIALDTFPYNGTTTTVEALWMGVPVVTLAGGHHVARVGASILSHLGMEEFVAHTPEEFIAIAGNLACDLKRLSRIRRTLRERLSKSVLCDDAYFTRRMENAYLTMLGRGGDERFTNET